MNTFEETLRLIESSFLDLEFEEGRHLYKVGNKILTSTSSMIKNHVPEFKEKETAANVAKQRGIKTSEVLKEWETKRVTAATNGTNVHFFAEHYIDNPLLPYSNKQELAAKKFIDENILNGKYTVLYPELKMYSAKYGYAGTADLPLWDNESGGVIIADYKTNYDLDKQYGYLLEPFAYTPNTPFCKYQIQLSYYQILLEEIGIEVKERMIIWLKDTGDYQIRKCADFTSQLKDFLNNDY